MDTRRAEGLRDHLGSSYDCAAHARLHPSSLPKQFAKAPSTRMVSLKSEYFTLLDFLRRDQRPAIIEPGTAGPLTHLAISNIVRNFQLRGSTAQPPTVAIALRNGPLLAVTCLATAAHYVAAPLDVASGPAQFQSDVILANATVVLTSHEDMKRLGLDEPWVAAAGIAVFVVYLTNDSNLLTLPINSPPHVTTASETHLNGPDDFALQLFTSGTSGSKKVVPLSLHTIVTGAALVIDSWGLTESDICLNMMPLNHVGGLIRNLFAPIMSGGSTICTTNFDANLFWDVVEDHHPTWYYASPTMHSVILDVGKERPGARQKSTIRLVCNAAGGLLPTLARQLQDTFNCTVLPSYGMTECMPISTPPLRYMLDRPGTSGISVGPEIEIQDHAHVSLPAGIIGSIVVRGSPLFQGYLLPDGRLDASTISKAGWFDTGDTGYLDVDGYLYITGRAKEVINRGGELISPFEVEEAILKAAQTQESSLCGQISEVLAFSSPHQTLQEVVAIAVVVPPGIRRPDLRSIHKAVKSSLHQSKWPVLLVYMDALPRKNNKLLRLNLAERLSLPAIGDQTLMLARHLIAFCPPANTPLSERIASRVYKVDLLAVLDIARKHIPPHIEVTGKSSDRSGLVSLILAPKVAQTEISDDRLCDELRMVLATTLDDVMMPEEINLISESIPLTSTGRVDDVRLEELLSRSARLVTGDMCLSSTERRVISLFSTVLAFPSGSLSPKSNFFDLGGDSLRAGELLARLRKEFQIRLPPEALFTNPEIRTLSSVIESRIDAAAPGKEQNPKPVLPDCVKTCSSTNFLVMCIQLIPLALLYPMKRALSWTIWVYAFTGAQAFPTNQTLLGRLFNLIITLGIARVVVRIVSPLLGILVKWMVIGKYKEGLYPMWGVYHTRWWFVQKFIAIAGMGIFEHSHWSRLLYYRMLGARIGKNVSIHEQAILGEYDLLDIRDGAVLDKCVCRPFAAERNTTMYLGQIVLGHHATIGLGAIVAAGSSVSSGVCIGPNSSSWEVDDADEYNRELLSSKIRGPHWLTHLFTFPLLALVRLVGALPWMFAILGLLRTRLPPSSDPLSGILIWFSSPQRLAFHYLAVVAHALLSPIFIFVAVLSIRLILRCFETEPRHDSTTFQVWKRFLMRTIYPNTNLHKLIDLFGTHYEATSIAVRLLGGKVGKRVYWPGNGPSMEYDLVDIGDDVVFGSRSHLVGSDGFGSNRVKIGNGAMVSDRCIVLPGVTIGDQAVLGSGAMTKRDKTYEAGSTWVGCKKGEAVCLSKPSFPTSTMIKSSFSNEGSMTSLSIQARLQRRFRDHNMRGNDSAKTVNTMRHGILRHISSSLKLQEVFEAAKVEKAKSGVEVRVIELAESPSLQSMTSSSTDSDDKFNRSGTVEASPEDDSSSASSTPFGRAFYNGQAPYRVLGLPTITLYSALITAITAFYWSIASAGSVQLIVAATRPYHLLQNHAGDPVRPLILFALFTISISLLNTLQAVLALLLTVIAKWALLGRRVVGSHDWDKTSYCQRWQLFLTMERLRRQCFGGSGILDLLTGTHYIVMYFRALGLKAGKDCALFAGGRPTLMFTEPDLLELGDRVCVDDASLVAHINTRGHFTLNKLSVGHRSVLRSGSRLLSGAKMEADACLLEHTLVMAGDVVEEGVTMQGWPGEAFDGQRVKL